MRDRRVKQEISISLQQRVRFEGDTEPPFWQADVWPYGEDYHAIGTTPQEALLRLAQFWTGRAALKMEGRDA